MNNDPVSIQIVYRTVTGLDSNLCHEKETNEADTGEGIIGNITKTFTVFTYTVCWSFNEYYIPGCTSDSEGSSQDYCGESQDDSRGCPVICTRNMSKEEKKEHKLRVKEENREKRTKKVPKHVKKRRDKLGKLRNKSWSVFNKLHSNICWYLCWKGTGCFCRQLSVL